MGLCSPCYSVDSNLLVLPPLALLDADFSVRHWTIMSTTAALEHEGHGDLENHASSTRPEPEVIGNGADDSVISNPTCAGVGLYDIVPASPSPRTSPECDSSMQRGATIEDFVKVTEEATEGMAVVVAKLQLLLLMADPVNHG